MYFSKYLATIQAQIICWASGCTTLHQPQPTTGCQTATATGGRQSSVDTTTLSLHCCSPSANAALLVSILRSKFPLIISPLFPKAKLSKQIPQLNQADFLIKNSNPVKRERDTVTSNLVRVELRLYPAVSLFHHACEKKFIGHN